MQSTYQVGQTVIANMTAQKLTKGEQYLVTHTIINQAPWGTFVDYVLSGPGSDKLIRVSNGHLLLSEV